MNTKEKIADIALDMFSGRGYEAVSIRDICGEVGIKESTLYYHYKNKQDILDSLIERFTNHINELLSFLDSPRDITSGALKGNDMGMKLMDMYMLDGYLFDPFCNKMLRLMMIEQFHNEDIRILYEKTLFDDPYKIQMSVFDLLVKAGLFSKEEAEWIVSGYYSYMTVLTFKYLLNGDLTDDKKRAYSKEAHTYMTQTMARFMKAEDRI